jgi:hypothetical protein
MIAIAIAFAVVQIAAPASASCVNAPGLSKAATVDLAAAKKKATKKKKKDKVQYMRSAC